MGSKRSWTDDELITAVKKHDSMRQVLFELGLSETGGNRKNVQKHMDRLELSFDLTAIERQFHGVKEHQYRQQWTNEQVFQLNSGASRQTVKARYIIKRKNNYSCDHCGIHEWNDKRLSLQIEHKNGNPHDHRLENLELLCPNCHSLTPTFAGKGTNKHDSPIEWPNIKELIHNIDTNGYSHTAMVVGCSVSGLRKHLMKFPEYTLK